MSDSKSRIDQALKALAVDFSGTPEDFVQVARQKLSIAVDAAYAQKLVWSDQPLPGDPEWTWRQTHGSARYK